jgi:hypothetical protein
MQQLSTVEVWVVFFLFMVSLSGMLRIAWQRAPITPRYVLQFLLAYAFVVVDAAVLIYNSKTYL